MGISKKDAKSLIKEHPDVPLIIISGNVYHPKAKLRNRYGSRGVINY